MARQLLALAEDLLILAGWRHLGGYGNMRQCTVLRTAFQLSADSLHDKLLASDRAEKEREQERRQSEPMVRHAAKAPPAFLYQAEWRGPSRGEAKMDEAEQRARPRLRDQPLAEVEKCATSAGLFAIASIVIAGCRIQVRIDYVLVFLRLTRAPFADRGGNGEIVKIRPSL